MNNKLQEKMSHFTDAIKKSLETKNWFSALLVALTLPDVCGYLENPLEKSSKRYVNWFNVYMKPKYTKSLGADHEQRVYLNGEDAYALRCSYLHSGSFHTHEQWIKDALNKFVFVVSENNIVHCNQHNEALQLQVDIFCMEVCEAVDKWLSENKANKDILEIADTMIEIECLENGFKF